MFLVVNRRLLMVPHSRCFDCSSEPPRLWKLPLALSTVSRLFALTLLWATRIQIPTSVLLYTHTGRPCKEKSQTKSLGISEIALTAPVSCLEVLHLIFSRAAQSTATANQSGRLRIVPADFFQLTHRSRRSRFFLDSYQMKSALLRP